MYFKKLLSIVSTASLVTAGAFALFSPSSALAAGLTSITATPSTQAVSTNANITLTFTPATAITNGSTIRVGFSSSYTGGAALTNADVAATGTNITSSTESAFTTTGFTSTLVTTGNVTTPVTIVIGGVNKLTSPVAIGNYSFSLITSVGDVGAVLQYVGQANVVQVRAVVPPTLSFVIRNTADTANTNTCDMGDLTTASVGTCSYRLKVGTNAKNGYTVSVATSGNFTEGVANFANAAAGPGGTLIAAGTETYGALVTKGNITGGTTTLAAVYNAGVTNSVSYVNTLAATLITANGPNNPAATDLSNTSLITHNAAIDSATTAGSYLQTVTYTVVGSF